MGSRAPLILNTLVDLVTAGAPAGVRVFDGPLVDGDPADAIHLGWDADPDSVGEAVTTTQEWAGLGAKKRNETVTVTNAIYLRDGAADPKAARTRGYQLLAVVEDAIHPLPSMGLPPPSWAGVTGSRLMYLTTEAGLEVWLGFTITVQTRP